MFLFNYSFNHFSNKVFMRVFLHLTVHIRDVHANTHRQRQMVALLIWDSKTDTYFHPPLLLPFSAETQPTVLCVHTSKPPPYSSKTRRLDRTGTAVLKPHHLCNNHTSEKNKHLGYKTNKQTSQQINNITCFINKAWLNHFLIESSCTWSLWYEHYTDGNRQHLVLHLYFIHISTRYLFSS